jgi:hypothetical protein
MAGILKCDQVQSDSNLSFQVAGANVAYMNSTGLQMTGGSLSLGGTTIIPAVGQYAFPATQNPSADANTLDDYEEGTWTPSISFGSGSATVTAAAGTYTKIGRVVTCSINIELGSASSAANLQINNLPFSQLNSHCSSGVVRENAANGLFYAFSFGSGTLVYMHRYDNSNTLSNGTTRYTGTYTYITS